MALRVKCACGKTVTGEDEDELWVNAQQHMAEDHPDLVGKIGREEILAQAEQA